MVARVTPRTTNRGSGVRARIVLASIAGWPTYNDSPALRTSA
jgi:hypothetical protein